MSVVKNERKESKFLEKLKCKWSNKYDRNSKSKLIIKNIDAGWLKKLHCLSADY